MFVSANDLTFYITPRKITVWLHITLVKSVGSCVDKYSVKLYFTFFSFLFNYLFLLVGTRDGNASELSVVTIEASVP